MTEKPIMHGHDHRPGGMDPVPGIGDVPATVGCHLQGGTSSLTADSETPVPVTVIDYDPQTMCSGTSATFVTAPQDGLYLLVGTASFTNMPTGSVATSNFHNLSGTGHYPLTSGVESAATDTAPDPSGGTPNPCTTSTTVCPLSSGDEVEFRVEVHGIGVATVTADCVWSLTLIGQTP